MVKFHGQRTCPLNMKEYLPDNYTHNNRSYASRRRIPHRNTYNSDLHLSQIRKTLLKFCNTEHQLLPNTYVHFEPDYHDKIRISIENIPIELPDREVKTFLSEYATPIGKTYYPGITHYNKYFTT